jgi:hypothetical protein
MSLTIESRRSNPETLTELKIGLWNIDHPESGTGCQRKESRFQEVEQYLLKAGCDLYIITEANAAIALTGYYAAFSAESPFTTKRRFYGEPNRYHQVAIYSKLPIQSLVVAEPINGLLCRVLSPTLPLLVYGNVITIKDQWAKWSKNKYADRLGEQLTAIAAIPAKRTLIGGDFNLRIGWPQKHAAHQQMLRQVAQQGLKWPTQQRDDTVQHVLHTSDLATGIALESSVRYSETGARGLSDHPFVTVNVGGSQKMNIWHGHDMGHVEITLSLDLSPEITLRILSNGIYEIDPFVLFLKKAKDANPKAAEAFLDSFLSAITEALDLQDFELKAKPDKKGGPLDFVRPSPCWLMLKRFIEGLAEEEVFRSAIDRHVAALPRYIAIRRRG